MQDPCDLIVGALTSHPLFLSPPPHELSSLAARILEPTRSPGVSNLCWIPDQWEFLLHEKYNFRKSEGRRARRKQIQMFLFLYVFCCFDLLIVVPVLMTTMLFQVVPEKAFILVDGSQAMMFRTVSPWNAVLHAIPNYSNHYKMRNTVSTTMQNFIDMYHICIGIICIHANIWWSKSVIKIDFRQNHFLG